MGRYPYSMTVNMIELQKKADWVRRETLEHELTTATPSPGRAAAQRVDPAGRMPGRTSSPGKDRTERLLLLLLARDPGRLEGVVELVRPEEFRGAVNRELYEAMVRHGAGGGDLATLQASDEARTLLEALLGDREEIAAPDQALADAVEELLMRPHLRRLEELQGLMARAEGAEQDALYAEAVALQKTVKEKAARLRSLGAKASNRWRRGHGER